MDIATILFDQFELLDACGPIEVFGRHPQVQMKSYSLAGGLIYSRQGVAIETLPIDTFKGADVLLIPGGQGTRSLVGHSAFLAVLRTMTEQSSYVLSVCTGSALLAMTGVLNGRKATSNKRAFDWVQSLNEKVQWIGSARWVVDGPFYTSSGVSAGIDMTLGFYADQFGLEAAKKAAEEIEYIWIEDKNHDPFAKSEYI